MLTRLPLFAIPLASITPAAMVLEMLADEGSHNLFPFKIIVYALLQAPAMLGAAIGYGARWLLFERRQRPQG